VSSHRTPSNPLCQGFYYGINYGERGRKGVLADEMPTNFIPPPGRYAPNDLSWYAKKLYRAEAKIDYFATSLPTMLLFQDDLQKRRQTAVLFLMAQAQLGLGKKSEARKLLALVLKADPNHALAADLVHTTRAGGA